MSDRYRYIDPAYTYADPNTGVLKNRVGATDADTLLLVESGMVAKRIEQLQANPIRIKNISTLLEIHKHLFQDIYLWAGEIRTVEISKQGNPFFPLAYFHNALAFIDTLIADYRKILKDDKPRLARKLAEILESVNHLHPFREGNGRTQREFLRLLALEKNLTLNLNPSNDTSIYERYMSGTVNSDVETLASLILELIENSKL